MHFLICRANVVNVVKLTTTRCEKAGLKIEDSVRNLNYWYKRISHGENYDSKWRVRCSIILYIDVISVRSRGSFQSSDKVELNDILIHKGSESWQNGNLVSLICSCFKVFYYKNILYEEWIFHTLYLFSP